MAKPVMKIIDVTENKDSLTITFRPDRKSLKAWAKILQVEGYKSTEFLFPRKKKRGTMRRMRKMKRRVHCRECIHSRDLYGDGDCYCLAGPTLETTPGWDHHCAAGEMIKLNEPSCGGGGMIIGAFKVLKDAGHDPHRYMKVVAQDLDWKGVYMTYLQLSLLGVKAVVVQGDTLMEPWTAHYPPERVLRTPAGIACQQSRTLSGI